MSDDNEPRTTAAPTRRDYVKYGGAVIGGGLLAGCAGGGADSSTDTGPDDGTDPSSTPTGGVTGSTMSSETGTTADEESYSVTMSPAGTVTFDAPPKSAFTVLVHHADMALALGHGNAINAIYSPSNFGPLYDLFLERLDGVSVEWEDLPNSWNIGKETLYELDSDVHLADPVYMTSMDGWATEDIEEVGANVAPWFGNAYSDRHRDPPEAWTEGYEYYTLWGIFEKVARVFRREDRYRALAGIHRSLIAEIRSNRPPKSERPRVARVQMGLADGTPSIYPFNINDPGFEQAHIRPLGVTDALSNVEAYSKIGLEALAEADPEVILATHAMGPGRDFVGIREYLRNDPVAQGIAAVENDRVYPMAIRFGGPIANLFQLEMAAKQLYPERFGEWPAYEGGPYPEFSAAERLFDRERVANIIKGNV